MESKAYGGQQNYVTKNYHIVMYTIYVFCVCGEVVNT